MKTISKSRFSYSLHKKINTKPFSSETIVTDLSADEIEYKLWCAVKPDYMQLHKKLERRFLFSGIVQKYFFKMVKRNVLTEKFSPLVLGKVEETSKGSIVFLRYFMSPNATFLMLYFFISTSVIGLFFIDYESTLVAFAIPTVMFVLSYVFAMIIFSYQLSRYGSLIKKILSRKPDEDIL